jgi:diguanylate cyclase (GGDEF)-like protein
VPGRADLHRTLERQLRRLGVTCEHVPAPAAWAQLLAAVSATYQGADVDRYTLERSIEISSDEMRALHDKLSAQARHDALTGMPNRMALLEQLGIAQAKACRDGGPVALLFVDLDGFKLINDRLGHAGGDQLLIGASQRITRAVRAYDIVGRLGGDEFVVLCQAATDSLEAVRIAERIVRSLQAPFRILGQDSAVSASVGAAVMTDPYDTPEVLLQQADIAMYRAKAQGRGRVVLFDAAMQARAEECAELETAIGRAVELGELVLHYQPVVKLSDGSVQGYEALVRWDRPGRGLIGPGQFIPAAERARLISPIGDWVVGEACREAARWPAAETSVAINLTAHEVARGDVVDSVTNALDRSGLAPTRLIVELRESTIFTGKDAVSANLERLLRLGVRIAIDDFGTGHSSLSHLRDLPASILKIDRSFIRDVDASASAPAIVGAIVTMAHALGLIVVAKGIERPAQLQVVRALDCDLAQGYLLGRPESASHLNHGASHLPAPA